MSSAQKILLLGSVAGFTLLTLLFIPPIPQPPAFHHFADTRTVWGIPNFSNVATNIPFLFVGYAGLSLVLRSSSGISGKLAYAILFAGVILTGLGSAYYHWAPDNDRLVWDRLPMTIVFMSLLSAIVAQLVNPRLGKGLLVPLVLTGIGSVYWWHYTETLGHGDLRLYMWVQFFPMLTIVFLLILYYQPTLKPVLRVLVKIVIWYAIAKALEQLDYPIFRALRVSGHALKHLAAIVSTAYFIILFRLHNPTQPDPVPEKTTPSSPN